VKIISLFVAKMSVLMSHVWLLKSFLNWPVYYLKLIVEFNWIYFIMTGNSRSMWSMIPRCGSCVPVIFQIRFSLCSIIIFISAIIPEMFTALSNFNFLQSVFFNTFLRIVVQLISKNYNKIGLFWKNGSREHFLCPFRKYIVY